MIKKKNKGTLLIVMGLLLIAAAFLLTAYNLYDDRRAQQSADSVVSELESCMPVSSAEDAASEISDLPDAVPADEIEIPDYILNPEMEMPEESIDGTAYIGILRIPSLELELPVISAWSYPDLKTAPCRYSGSAYAGGLIIAGHNYRSHFGNLYSLRAGDTVTFTDTDGNLFVYAVAEIETLKGTAIEEMESGGWDLTLFTCTMDGRSRVTVRCMRAEG